MDTYKQITPESARDLAHQVRNSIEKTNPYVASGDALTSLSQYDWREINGPLGVVDNSIFHGLNLKLDPRGCLGKIAFLLALLEEHHPDERKDWGCTEVYCDGFRQTLLNQWKNMYSKLGMSPDSWVEELLMYEEPHLVCINSATKIQFDPIFLMEGVRVTEHPVVGIVGREWNQIAAGMLQTIAVHTEDPQEALEVIRYGMSLSPLVSLVEAKIYPLTMLGRMEDVLNILKVLVKLRPTAAVFYLFETLFYIKHWDRPMHYDDRLWELIFNQIERRVAQNVA